jgi:hypothetical protein
VRAPKLSVAGTFLACSCRNSSSAAAVVEVEVETVGGSPGCDHQAGGVDVNQRGALSAQRVEQLADAHLDQGVCAAQIAVVVWSRVTAAPPRCLDPPCSTDWHPAVSWTGVSPVRIEPEPANEHVAGDLTERTTGGERRRASAADAPILACAISIPMA